jgi:hypothetical protein
VSAPQFTIEKGIEPPVNKQSKYPFAQMEPGDSFFIPGMNTSAEISSAVSYRKNRYGESYRCRAVEGGLRVWRVA